MRRNEDWRGKCYSQFIDVFVVHGVDLKQSLYKKNEFIICCNNGNCVIESVSPRSLSSISVDSNYIELEMCRLMLIFILCRVKGFEAWTFSTVRCWGEKPAGLYQLIITDRGAGSVSPQRSGTLVKWSLTLHGSSLSPAHYQSQIK